MSRDDLGKILKQKRIMIPLTLKELATRSGISASHIGRIERGERFPSARILRKLAEPLGFEETELFTLADYIKPSPGVETPGSERLDPYVASVLSQEPVEIQRAVVTILSIFKSLAKGISCDIEFREYAHRKYPQLNEDIITMIEDLIERLRGAKPLSFKGEGD